VSSSSMPRLGKGLESLIPKSFLSSGKSVSNLPIDSIVPNEYQPRLHFDEAAIKSLSESIKTHGLAQPIIVRRKGEGYELIAGERRLRASKFAGLESIPAIVRELSDKEALQLALVENLDREDLNPIEEAKGYKRMSDEFQMSHAQIADIFSRSRSTVTNMLRLLALPEDIQNLLSANTISEGHARTLLSASSEEQMRGLLARVLSEGLTVRQLEKLLAEPGAEVKVSRETGVSKHVALESAVSDRVGVKVSIKGSAKKGKLVLEFASKQQLGRILALLGVSAEQDVLF